MATNAGVCGITGANGYVGRVITRYLWQNGWRVYQLVRPRDKPTDSVELEKVIPFSLEGGVESESLKGMDALVHCAYDFRQIRWHDIERVNIEGTRRVFQATSAAGVERIVFVSSLAAYEGCKSLYGKAKLLMEEQAQTVGATIIRPGLVYGPNAGGLFGTLRKITTLSKVIPLIDRGDQTTCLAHEEDLSKLVLRVLQRPERVSNPIVAASEHRKTFRQLLEAIGDATGKKSLFVPMPSNLILMGLRLLEAAGIKLSFGSDNLISFLNPNLALDFAMTREMGIPFREFSARTLFA